MSTKKLRCLLLVLILILTGTGLLVFLYFHDPSQQPGLFPRCFFHQLTGLYCPGCGNTRALYALLHLDWRASLAANALFLPMCLTLALCLLQRRLITKAPFYFSLIAVLLLFAILRNLPWEPFTLLAPH